MLSLDHGKIIMLNTQTLFMTTFLCNDCA